MGTKKSGTAGYQNAFFIVKQCLHSSGMEGITMSFVKSTAPAIGGGMTIPTRSIRRCFFIHNCDSSMRRSILALTHNPELSILHPQKSGIVSNYIMAYMCLETQS